MTEYAIIVAVVAISAITAFKYFGGVQRSQVAAITQELAGQESGDTLALAQSYASRARNAAGRDLGLGDYYAGGGSYGGGGSCPISPARAAQKASGTNYVWAAQTSDEGCDAEKAEREKLEQDKAWLQAQIDLLFCHNQPEKPKCEPVLKETNIFSGPNGADNAAKEVLNALTALAHQAQLEIGGYINKMTAPAGTVYYQYTKPIVGERRSVDLSTTPRQIGYHTHPSGSLNFSNRYTHQPLGIGSDAKWVSDSNNHLYVGAIQGGDVKIGICEYESDCMNHAKEHGNPPTREIQ